MAYLALEVPKHHSHSTLMAEAVIAHLDSQGGDRDLSSQWEQYENLLPCLKTATILINLCSFIELLSKSLILLLLLDQFLPF